jgi:2-iminobutanoate/2-iminopropanoate deaminase
VQVPLLVGIHELWKRGYGKPTRLTRDSFDLESGFDIGLAGPETGRTMSFKTVIRPAGGAPPVGPYSHAVRVGDLLFCAGQIPLDPATGNLIAGDVQAQTERVLLNVKAILDAENLTFGSVVKTTVFLVDLGEFAAMNEVYARWFTGEYPARSTVQVGALPRGARVEIEVIAHY